MNQTQSPTQEETTKATASEPGQQQISIFRTGALERALLQNVRLGLRKEQAGASDSNQKPWGLLYKALSDSLGADPDKFQLVYPFTSWNWPTQQVGFISAAQFDFCAAVPQWSAVGQYSSSGDLFHQAYQEFLNVIVAATDDPVLRQKILDADNTLTAASNDYTTVYGQARSVYNDAVQNNDPSFTNWLASGVGKGWQSQITRAQTKLDQAQKNYDALVAQANTPGLADAQTQYRNEAFYSKLNDPGLSGFPKVPQWRISQNASDWVDKIKAGDGPAGATMGFTNRDASYDYSKTWAKGSLSVGEFFWEVNVSGNWERVTEFESDQHLEVGIEFEAVDLIQIQPSLWYNGSFVRSKANGPFAKGYSPDGGDGTQAVFGKKGFIGLLKTGMYVGYKPTFTIQTSKETFNRFLERFKTAVGVRIGPFTIDASGGIERAGWTYSAEGQTFTGTSTSETPLILGISISELPSGGAKTEGSAAPAERRGTCYRFRGRLGDVLAERVTEGECLAMGGESWRETGVARVSVPLRNLRVNLQAHPGTLVLDGPDGEMEQLAGVTHVSVFPLFNRQNGGPDPHHLYRIRAVTHLGGNPVDLQAMRFGGIGPFTGAARFASQ